MDINERDEFGYTKLHLATLNGDVAEVRHRVVEADEDVLRAGVDALELRARVNVVNHLLEVERVARLRVDVVGVGVAENAEADFAPRPAVRLEQMQQTGADRRKIGRPLTGQAAVAIRHMHIANVVSVLADNLCDIAFFQRHVKQVSDNFDVRMVFDFAPHTDAGLRLLHLRAGLLERDEEPERGGRGNPGGKRGTP